MTPETVAEILSWISSRNKDVLRTYLLEPTQSEIYTLSTDKISYVVDRVWVSLAMAAVECTAGHVNNRKGKSQSP